jgi:predicted transcriptional regulator
MKYITFLEEQGLVQRLEGQRKRYEITGRGADIIKYFDEIETNLAYKKPMVSSIKIHNIR